MTEASHNKVLTFRIQEILLKFPEVNWDRWSGDLNTFYAFGWVAREDTHEDYVEIAIVEGKAESISTSSAKYGDEFCARLGFYHYKCKRIEDSFEIPNMIKLKG